jgi:hypothetical protein
VLVKNIVNENQSTMQILFGLMDLLVCPFLNLVVYFECVWEEATSAGNLFPEHQIQGIPNFLSTIFGSEHFPSSNMVNKLGTHSIRKGAATYASCNGITKDWISKRGHWRGQAQMVNTCINTYQVCFLFESSTHQLIF